MAPDLCDVITASGGNPYMAVTQEFRCLHAVSNYNRPTWRIRVNLTIGLFPTPFGELAVALSSKF
jgi:hypothetical protein